MRSRPFLLWKALAGWTLLASLPMAAPALGADPVVELRHRDTLGGTYQLRSATYLIDGRPFFQGGAPPTGGEPDLLHRGTIPPGIHAVAIQLVYEGDSEVFSYIKRYRLLMRGRMTVELRPGYALEVRTFAEPRFDPTLAWEDRVRFRLEGIPRKAVLDLQVDPIEKQAIDTDGSAVEEPVTVTTPKDEEKRLQREAQEDVQQAALKVRGGETPEPERPREHVEVKACSAPPIHFGYGRFTLRRRARRTLARLAECLKGAPGVRLLVEGHCDLRGTSDYNQQLGQWRAESAAAYLLERGVPARQIEPLSFGEARPLCRDDKRRCHARNRRVVFSPLEDVSAR